MNELSGAEAAVRMLQAYDVKYIFGLCGDTSLPLYDALHRLDHGMQHILTRDERSAAYMADAYARITGKVGVCEGPSGGGATYILPGVVEANESSSPLVAITSDVPVSSRGKYPLTELDQKSLFRPLTKWNAVVDTASQIPGVFRTAFRAATTGRPGAAHIGLPYDLQKSAVAAEEVWAQIDHAAAPAWRVAPDPNSVAAAIELLLAARRPVFICGGGIVISQATEELATLAELLDAPIAFTVSGHGVISDDHPLSVGVVGSNGGTPETREVVQGADLVVFIGCRAGSTTTEHWKVPGRNVPIIHVDIDPMAVSANYKSSVGLVGDAKLVLAALLERLEAKVSKPNGRGAEVRAELAALKARKWSDFNRLALSDEQPIRPERVLATLQRVLPPDAVIAADPGTPCPYLAGYYSFATAGRHFLTNRAHGALGYSLAAIAGAWYGRPQSKCVAVMGDGSFGFAVGELETLIRHRIPVTLIVLSNSSFGWIKASQKTGYEKRYYSVDFTRTDHARIAEAYGLKSWSIQDPSMLEAALRAAVEEPGPTLVDVITQPLEESAVPVSQWMG